MKKPILWGLAGISAGVLLTVLIVALATPSVMLKEAQSRFNSFEEATTAFEAAVSEQGWKLPTIHDLQGTMEKYNYDVDAVKVYELCHPDHASKILALDDERIVSSMMPCRVSIYKKSDGKVYVSWMNTGLMGGLFGGVIAEVMNEASSDSLEMIQSIL